VLQFSPAVRIRIDRGIDIEDLRATVLRFRTKENEKDELGAAEG